MPPNTNSLILFTFIASIVLISRFPSNWYKIKLKPEWELEKTNLVKI